MIREIEMAGFLFRGGKGSHKNFIHPSGVLLTLSGKPGDDAKPYQEKLIKRKLLEIQNEDKR